MVGGWGGHFIISSSSFDSIQQLDRRLFPPTSSFYIIFHSRLRDVSLCVLALVFLIAFESTDC